MPCYADQYETPPQVLPVRALLATLLACLGASYLLVPSDSEMVERLMLDQQYERLATILNSELGKGANITSTVLHTLSAEQVAALSQLLRLTPREQLAAIFTAPRPPKYDRITHSLVMASIRYIDVIMPNEAWELISPHEDRMSGRQFLEIATLLGRNALALRQPHLTASILDRASQLPEADVQTVTDMAQAYRWSSQSGTGAVRLHAWLKTHADKVSREEYARLSALNSTIALEGGKPGLAFDICLEELRGLPANSADHEPIERAITCAAQAGRTRELLPWLQRVVASLPESKMPLKELHQQALKNPGSLAEYKKWAGELAKFADWNSEFETGFDQHLRLAIAGSLDSLDRCVALWDFLGCGEELSNLLVELGPQQKRPELQLVLAGLLASLGRDTEARPLYEQWLVAHPEDRDARYDLACLLEDMGDEDACLAALKEFINLHPNDVPAIKKLADNYIRSENYEEALALYSHLREEDHDHYTLENYEMIAESLDRHEDLFRAQMLTAKAASPPLAEPYLDMAETAGYLADREEAVKFIEEGLNRLPESAAIRVALADFWMKDDQYEKAWAVLRHDCVKHSFEGVTRILNLAPDLADQHEVLAFLGNDIEKHLKLPPSSRLDLAVLHALNGDSERAEKLFASVPLNDSTFRLHALARFTIGSYEEAAGMMERHVALKRNVTSDDEVFLGDVYELLGREEDAKRAYGASIDLIAGGRPETAALQALPQAPIAKQP